jgi:hypothetical protein
MLVPEAGVLHPDVFSQHGAAADRVQDQGATAANK